MLPAYALGNWWSRYHAYTQDEYISLIERFKAEDIPFSVSVVDMDWHITKIPEDQKYGDPVLDRGWTGYTWNKELFPYLYTMNYRTHTQLEPLIQPMYYRYPRTQLAYEAKRQYFFGSELMVAPVTEPNSPVDHLGGSDVFLPEGERFDFFDGTHYSAAHHRKMRVFRALDKYPVFAKAGAIVPMQAHVPGSNILGQVKELIFMVFPGADNQFTLYEDANDGNDFENGQWVKTEALLFFGETTVFEIKPSFGACGLLPPLRTKTVKFRGFAAGAEIRAAVEGIPQVTETTYDASTCTYTASVTCGNDQTVSFTLLHARPTDNPNRDDRVLRILVNSNLATKQKEHMWKIIEKGEALHKKLHHLNEYVSSAADGHLIDAIREQYTLACGEYDIN